MNVLASIAEWHKKLCEQPAYKQYVVAKTNEAAVEGSLRVDTHMAAGMLRRAAVEAGVAQMATVQLATICREIARLIDRRIDWTRRKGSARPAARRGDIGRECVGAHGKSTSKTLSPP